MESFVFLLISFILFFYFSNKVFSQLFFSKKIEKVIVKDEFYEKKYSNKKLFNISEEKMYLFRIALFITQYIFIII
jgi:hypothetical protein